MHLIVLKLKLKVVYEKSNIKESVGHSFILVKRKKCTSKHTFNLSGSSFFSESENYYC